METERWGGGVWTDKSTYIERTRAKAQARERDGKGVVAECKGHKSYTFFSVLSDFLPFQNIKASRAINYWCLRVSFADHLIQR